MSITKESELVGMKKVSEVVGTTLKLMRFGVECSKLACSGVLTY